MRYIKVLILAIFFFFALMFFFQNQGPLSQHMEMTLNLFFIPPFITRPLPFYFLLIGAFLIGCLLSLAFLLWDKFATSAKLVRSRWKVKSLETEVDKLREALGKAQEKAKIEQAQLPPAQVDAPSSSNAPDASSIHKQ